MTDVVSVSELFPGLGSPLRLAVLVSMVPFAAEASTLTTMVKVWLPTAAAPFVAVMVPVPPTAGVITVKPTGAVNDTKVVSAGMLSLSVTAAAVDPMLATVIV